MQDIQIIGDLSYMGIKQLLMYQMSYRDGELRIKPTDINIEIAIKKIRA